MRTPILAGNWKMNGTRGTVDDLLLALSQNVHFVPHVQLVVFPPAVFMEQTERQLAGTEVAWGGQNFYPEPAGAFTGEVSAPMLADLGCRFVLVGHSERRKLFGESNELIARKFKAAIEAGLTPVLCIGETREEREQGITFDVLREQLAGIFALGDGATPLIQAVIAYEPVWAIGTGLVAEPEVVQEVHAAVRSWVAERDKNIAQSLRILYGGSLNRKNAASLLSLPDVDGGLVGGASLNALEFLDMAHLCKR